MPAAEMRLVAALVLGVVVQMTWCDREHKVHNIVLYPERHSWCQTTAIKQVVAYPGYEPVTIDNNVCVGACYSYSIPRTEPAEPGELIRPYCDSCQPVGTRCYHVILRADSNNIDEPKTIQKRVQIITNCSCLSCDTVQDKDCEILDQTTSELPSDLFSLLHPNAIDGAVPEIKPPPEEVPELLHFSPPPQTTATGVKKHESHLHKFELNPKLIDLLKAIQNDDDDEEDYDREQLKGLLDTLEDSNHELTDQNLLEFINFVNIHNSDDFELDLGKLKEVLVNYKGREDLMGRHRDFGLGDLNFGAENNADIERDLEGVDASFGIEGSRHGMGRGTKGSHVGMGLRPVVESLGTSHHRLGEPQRIGLDVGHLIRGPHGSLAFSPDTRAGEGANLDDAKTRREGVASTEN